MLGENASQDVLDENKASSYEAQGVIKQTYSRLSTMYCMLPEYHSSEINESVIKSLNLETLALKWMDQSFEVLILFFLFCLMSFPLIHQNYYYKNGVK